MAIQQQVPTIGRIVQYCLAEGPTTGTWRPALIVGEEMEILPPAVGLRPDLRVFLNASQDVVADQEAGCIHRPWVPMGDQPGMWRWPPYSPPR